MAEARGGSGAVGDAQQRIADALDVVRDGISDGDHHKMWTIDQMVRALTGCPMVTPPGCDYEVQGESEEYHRFVAEYCDGEDGPDTYSWDEGIAP